MDELMVQFAEAVRANEDAEPDYESDDREEVARVECVVTRPESIALWIRLVYPAEAKPLWKIVARRLVTYQMHGPTQSLVALRWEDDDPLQREYTDRTYTLGFLGKPADADALAADLLNAKSRFEREIGRDFGNGINTTAAFYRAGHGFAGGATESLLPTYKAIFETHGIETYLLPRSNRANLDRDALRVLRIGSWYIVAEEFTAEPGIAVSLE